MLRTQAGVELSLRPIPIFTFRMPKTCFYPGDKIARMHLTLHSGRSKYAMLNGVINYRTGKA
jgi:hypothetical protein